LTPVPSYRRFKDVVILPGILLLPILLLLVVGIVLLRGGRGVAPRAVRPIRTPVCPACRYPVEGLRRAECPECGGDLSVAGVIDVADPPRWRRTAGRLLTVVGGSLVLLPLLTFGLDRARPNEWTLRNVVFLKELPRGAPSGTPTRRLEVEVVRTRMAWRRPTVDGIRAAAPRVLIVMPDDGDRVLLEGAGSEPWMRDPATLAERMNAGLGDAAAAHPVAATAAVVAATLDDRLRLDTVRATAEADAQAVARAAPGSAEVDVLGVASDLQWRRGGARWPLAVAGTVAGGIAAIGLVVVAREHRRAAPVPWTPSESD
jgi:hypothetical protein